MDSMGTGMYVFEGSAVGGGKTIIMESHYDDPMAGPMKLRALTKMIDRNTEIFEMYGADKTGQERRCWRFAIVERLKGPCKGSSAR